MDAEPLVYWQAVVEFLMALNLRQVRQVVVAISELPDYLRHQLVVPSARPVWFVARQLDLSRQHLLRELRLQHRRAVKKPCVSVPWRRPQVRKNPVPVPGRRLAPETWLPDLWL